MIQISIFWKTAAASPVCKTKSFSCDPVQSPHAYLTSRRSQGMQCWPLCTGLNIQVKRRCASILGIISHMYMVRNIYCTQATARNQVSRFWIWIYLFATFLRKSPTTQVNLFSAYSLLKHSDKLPMTDSSVSVSICLLLCCLKVLGRNHDSACLDAANGTLWRRSILTVIIRVSCNQNHCSKENFGKSWTHIQTSCSGHFCGNCLVCILETLSC